MPINRDIDDRLRRLRRDYGDRLDRLEQRVRALRYDVFIDEFSPGGSNDGAIFDWIDFLEIAVPANPDANWRRVFANTATNKMSVRTSGGVTINLEYGDTEAIAAIEGEATLDLTGEVTIASGKSLTLKTDGATGGLKLGAAGDVILYRGAANKAYLGTGDSFHLVSGALEFGADVSISRGAANRLDLASGDSFHIVSGSLETNVIAEVGAGVGVTIDGLLVKDKTLISPWDTLTVAAGQVTRTQLFHEISGQGAANDDLVGIAGGLDGMLLIIHPTADAVTITVKHNDVGGESVNGTRIFFADNLDKTLDDIDDLLMLIYDSGLDGGNGAWIGLVAGGAHAMLSASHSDTLAAGVSRGSLILGNATPAWAELTIGTAKKVVTSDGTDASWADPARAFSFFMG